MQVIEEWDLLAEERNKKAKEQELCRLQKAEKSSDVKIYLIEKKLRR